MGAMAIPAARRLYVSPKGTKLGVEGIAVGGQLVLVAGAADGRGLRSEFRFGRLQDGVGRMAVGADRRFEVAGRNGMTMRTSLVVIINLGVAGPAGFGDVGLECRTGGILVTEDVVRSVATLAVGRNKQAFFAQGEAVN